MKHEVLPNPRSGVALPDWPVHDASPSQFHQSLPFYEKTPLIDLPQIAETLGVGRFLLKDESWRLGLPSFKMLGASWATAFGIREEWVATGVTVSTLNDLKRVIANPHRKRLVAATDGNHGRGVARMAKYLGMKCLIFVPKGLAKSRIKAIKSEGARVKVVRGSYDDAIVRAAKEANDYTLVISDTSWPGYENIPRQVTAGYATMFKEIDDVLEAIGAEGPDLVVLQAGVGSFAAAGMLHYKAADRAKTPRTVVVEPTEANCLFRSCKMGEISEAPGPHRSTMAGLNCGLPSQLTWPVLDSTVDTFTSITDDATFEAMRMLADHGIVAGESGAAGLGVLLSIVKNDDSLTKKIIGLTPDATVLVVNTEGATDPKNFCRVVGLDPDAVAKDRDRRREENGSVELGH